MAAGPISTLGWPGLASGQSRSQGGLIASSYICQAGPQEGGAESAGWPPFREACGQQTLVQGRRMCLLTRRKQCIPHQKGAPVAPTLGHRGNPATLGSLRGPAGSERLGAAFTLFPSS